MSTSTTEPTKKSGQGLIIAAVVVGAIVLLGLAYFMMNQSATSATGGMPTSTSMPAGMPSTPTINYVQGYPPGWAGADFSVPATGPSDCLAYAQAHGYAGWGYRNSDKSDPYHDTCFMYNTYPPYTPGASPAANIVSGCANGGNPATGCK